jgi:hypothetical protein
LDALGGSFLLLALGLKHLQVALRRRFWVFASVDDWGEDEIAWIGVDGREAVGWRGIAWCGFFGSGIYFRTLVMIHLGLLFNQNNSAP